MKLTQDQFIEFQELADEIGGEVYENYSGRGMFGRKCLGITVDNDCRSLFSLGREVEIRQVEFGDMMNNVVVDSLGRNYIIYFPSIEGVEDID